MVNNENVSNILAIILTFCGLAIGFINEQYRILVWSISLIVMVIIVVFIIVKQSLNKIDKNESDIIKIKQDLNIANRLSILETKISFLEKGIK